ncbi:sigma-70 family RNA polymerase sigma factor [Fictibacillus nanhaiensis]|uniref:sigma-70 family RNA polymerase sigma factor n=1 Tax=Fictibacillus nanhaiensis TaxID=742169 RepID=UPI002E1CDD80|nr:sigma-70 family RNA polymerase sigma factor [Fictibacillus nanhaiensis]
MSRYPLILDNINSSDDVPLAEQIPSPELDICDQIVVYRNSELSKIIENERLFQAINLLTSKQQKVLDLIYVQGFNNKEVADLFKETPQNISNIHKQAIKKIKKILTRVN